jgi:hypothetical protein
VVTNQIVPLAVHALHHPHEVTFTFLKVQAATLANIAVINPLEHHLVHALVVLIRSTHILLRKAVVMCVNSVDTNQAELHLVHAQRVLTRDMNTFELA